MKTFLFALLLAACNNHDSGAQNNNTVRVAGDSRQSVVKTISELLSVTADDGATVTVLGYNNPGDQGGGVFYWDKTSSEKVDNGIVFKSAGGNGRWKRMYSGAVDVRWFGADAKGKVPASAAIQLAIDAGYKEINFGDAGSNFLLDKPLLIANADNIKLKGGATLAMSNNNDYHLILKGNNKKYLQHAGVTGLRFVAPGKGVVTSFTEFLSISQCLFSKTGLAMSLNANEQDIKPAVRQNIFYGSDIGLLCGETRVADCFITENYFVNNARYAISIGYMDGGTVAYNKIFNELPASNMNSGILIKKPIYSNIIYNDIMEINGTALKLLAPRYCNISNNNLINNGKSGGQSSIEIAPLGQIASEYNSIGNNNIKDAMGNAILLTGVSKSKLDNNNITLAKNAVNKNSIALSVNNCSALEIRNNQADGQNIRGNWMKSLQSDVKAQDNIIKGFLNSASN